VTTPRARQARAQAVERRVDVADARLRGSQTLAQRRIEAVEPEVVAHGDSTSSRNEARAACKWYFTAPVESFIASATSWTLSCST